MRTVTITALVTGVVLCGCGGAALAPEQRAGSSKPAAAQTHAGRSGSTAAGARPASPGVAFADCMRAHGLPSFPDPSSGGGLRFDTTSGVDPASPAFRAAQAKCQRLLPRNGLPGSGPPPSAQTMAKLVTIARCMRAHGISEFPDPRTSIPRNPLSLGAGMITDYEGAILIFPSTMDLEAPAYRQALHACGAPPLGLPH